MVTQIRLSVLVVAAFTTSCGLPVENDNALATKIERKLIAKHPDIVLKRFARFYSHDSVGFVSAIYVFGNEGYEPIAGKAGQIYWVSPQNLPVVDDGGCSIINLSYHKWTGTLVSVACNGFA